MRRALFALGPVVLLAGAVFACEDDPSNLGGPSFGLDAGPQPALDSGSQPFDGSSPDAPVGPPKVTVSIRSAEGAPKANVLVVFHDATGAVLETKVTGADGKASSTGVLPSMASALVESGFRRNIVTWTGVENGDELVLRDVAVQSEDVLGQVNVTLPGPFQNSTQYDYAAAGCSNGSDSTTATIYLFPYCARSPSSILATGRNVDGQIVGHSFKKGNAVPTDGGAVDVATGAWKPPSNVVLTVDNIAQNFASAELIEVADGYGYRNDFAQGLEGTRTFTIADGFADALQANLYLSGEPLGVRQIIAKRVAPTGSLTIDAAQALPAITSVDVTGADSQRPVVSWSATTGSFDGGLIRMWYYGAEEANYHWTFVVPPGSSSVTAPALPAEAASFLPTKDDAGATAVFRDPQVLFLEADVLPSYAQFRTQQGAIVDLDQPLDSSFPVVPVNGTFRASTYAVVR
jgi:hypothetical protein